MITVLATSQDFHDFYGGKYWHFVAIQPLFKF